MTVLSAPIQQLAGTSWGIRAKRCGRRHRIIGTGSARFSTRLVELSVTGETIENGARRCATRGLGSEQPPAGHIGWRQNRGAAERLTGPHDARRQVPRGTTRAAVTIGGNQRGR
jgi:hypothetical protein